MNKIAPGYYKTQESGLIRVLYEAIHAEIGDVFVVYQRLNISTQVLTISKAQFISKFSLVKADCCIEDIPLCLNPKYFFPDIHYDANLSELVDGTTFTKSVKSMITLLVNRGIISVDLIKNCEKDDDIELIIRERINTYTSGESLEEVFHLIQLWGGITGRGVYIKTQKFNWSEIQPEYQKIVETCLSITDVSDESIEKMTKAVRQFNKSISNMGVAFITKHTRYWLCKNLGENSLPIYDSVMAGCVMRKSVPDITHLSEYWKVMRAKAKLENIGMMPLERHIFKYAFSDRR